MWPIFLPPEFPVVQLCGGDWLGSRFFEDPQNHTQWPADRAKVQNHPIAPYPPTGGRCYGIPLVLDTPIQKIYFFLVFHLGEWRHDANKTNAF